MSRFFVKNENEGTIETFKKKQTYKIVSRSELPNLIDFNYAEKRLYGRVNRYYQPIVPNEKYISMKEFKTSTIEPIRAYDFVVKAFYELQNRFKIKALSGEISLDEKYLTDLIPVTAYRSPSDMYRKYSQAFIIATGNVISNNDLVFTDFSEFLNVMMPYIKNFLKAKPLTYPGFVKSKNCPTNISGLVVEIANIDPNNDKEKYDHFYNSKNWGFFLNACNTYGFMVDCNMPHRLVADINSSNMIAKMNESYSGINSADRLISNCYDTASLLYLNDFKVFLYNVYSYNKRRTIIRVTNTDSVGVSTTIKKIKSYTYDEFVQELGNDKLLDVYMKIRFMEEESNFTDYEINTIINSTIELAKISGENYAIEVFEKIINKTFDYSGSLSYIEDRKKKLGR